MPLPGSVIDFVDSPPSLSAPTDSGVGFAIGLAQTEASGLLRTLDQFVDLCGPRENTSPLYDAVETFFREGGSRLYVSTKGLSGLDADLVAALTEFDDSLGLGQVFAPGLTSATVQLAVLAHCNNFGRCAVLDGSDTATAATLTSQADALRGQAGSRFGALFAPWDVIPGITGGSNRTVPPSARIAGNIARNDSQGLSPNKPAAGMLGTANYVRALSQSAFSASDRQTLNEAGVNLSRIKNQGVRTYGWRSLADQTTDTEWSWFNNSRLIMVIKGRLDIISENFQFSEDDGSEINTSKFGGAIIGELMKFWPGSLFGATPSQAFSVDTSGAINTPTTLQNGELHARVGLRCSKFAEQIQIDIAKVPDDVPLS